MTESAVPEKWATWAERKPRVRLGARDRNLPSLQEGPVRQVVSLLLAVVLAEQRETRLFIADYHSMTSVRDATERVSPVSLR